MKDYNYALDSARECVPMIALSVMQKEMTQEQEAVFRDQAIHICNMIYRLIESCRDRISPRDT